MVHMPIANHFLVSCNIIFSRNGICSGKTIFDFNSPRDLFFGEKLDHLPSILNEFILRAWDLHAIKKFINGNSRPWYTPKAKLHRRRARYWERQRFRCKRRGSVEIDGRCFDLVDCDLPALMNSTSTLRRFLELFLTVMISWVGY